jgi:hypothetical protein
MKKKLKGILLFLIIAYLASFLTNLYIERTTPKFINGLIEQMKNDKNLMNLIGGYHSFEYHYSSNEYENADSLHFDGIITGNVKIVHFKGVAKKIKQAEEKNNHEWEIIHFEKSIK